MITRIEIDGFKTFQDFAVDLAPFQVIIGANGCGKSNFFDALELLSQVSGSNLYAGFHSLRGKLHEHFTQKSNGQPVNKMRFGVEMLVEPTVQDDLGQKVELQNQRLRYELEINYRPDNDGVEWLSVGHEALSSIPRDRDVWLLQHTSAAKFVTSTAEQTEYIRSASGGGEATVSFMPDSSGVFSRVKTFPRHSLKQTLLSAAQDCEFPHALAARQELQKWQFESLDTSVMRMSPDLKFPDIPARYITGNLIPNILVRLKTEHPRALAWVSRDMAILVPTIRSVEVAIEPDNRVGVYAATRDNRKFSMRVLSDGTLRLLALATLRNDPRQQGVICYEDPEEDVHPATLNKVVRLMREMTTDLSDPEQLKLPLRQLLVTTHSPELISELDIEQGELLFAMMTTIIVPGDAAWQVTRMVPVCSESRRGPEHTYALSKVIQYLNNPEADVKRDSLRKVLAP